MADGLQRLSEEEIEQLNAPQPVPSSGRTHDERSKSVDKRKQQIKDFGLEAMRWAGGPTGRIMNWLLSPEQINVDPKAPDNRYTADVLANRALLKALSGKSSQDVRTRAAQDTFARAGLTGIDTSEGPGSAARGVGAVTDAQSRATKASVQQILSDTSLMQDMLRGVHGAEEQYKWFRALSEAARLGTISQVNLGLLNDAKNRMASMASTVGVLGAKGYSAWERYQQGQKDKNELAKLNALDRRDEAAGIGTSSGPGDLGPGELDV